MGSRRIVVFGDVIDDVVIIPDAPVAQDTDTASTIRFRAGGSAANTAAWLGSLHAEVDFVGRVSAGDHERHVRLLLDSGVYPILAKDTDLPTGTVVMIVDGYRRTMLTDRGANTVLHPTAVTGALLSRAAALHLTGYSLFGTSDGQLFQELIKRAAAAGVAVSVNPCSADFLRDYGRDKFLEAVAGADFLLLSLEEGRALTGLDDREAITVALAELFPLVALTLGDQGAMLSLERTRPIHFETTDVPVADPTGAEDAFCAGFLNSFFNEHPGDAAAAVKAGVSLGARAVTTIGGRPNLA